MSKSLLMKDAKNFKDQLTKGNQEGILNHLSAFEYAKKFDELEMLINYNVFDEYPQELAEIIKKAHITSIIYNEEFHKNLKSFQGNDFYKNFSKAFNSAVLVDTESFIPILPEENLDIEEMEKEALDGIASFKISRLKSDDLKKQK